MPLASDRPAPRRPAFVVLICFVSIVFDGYDLVVYGATIAYETSIPSNGAPGDDANAS